MQWWAALPYTIPLFISALLASSIVVIPWKRRAVPGAIALTIMGLAAAVWSLGYALELSSAQSPLGLFWARMQYLGIVAVPVAWLVFALQYTGNGHQITRRTVALMLVMPLLTVALVWTNDFHKLVWPNVSLSTSGPFPILDFDHGPGFWLYNLFSHICLLLGAILLFRPYIRPSQIFRRQTLALVVGIAVPWLGNAIYVLNLSPWPGLDLTPFAITIAVLSIALGIVRFQFLALVPIARHSVIEGMSEGVIVLDDQNRLVDINPAALQSLGRPAEAVMGQPITQVLAEQPLILERYRGVFNTMDELLIEHDSERRFFDVRISPLYDRRRRVRGRLIVWRDISERKRMEEDLLRSKEAAEAANRAKSTFLANMSHELRTPLSAILGYSQLIQKDALERSDTRYEDELSMILSSGYHLLDLIAGILDYAKIEAGKMEIEPDRFDIAALVRTVVATVRPLLAENENTLEVQCPTTLGSMYADKTKTRQILMNLLSNATKFTLRGRIVLMVTREIDADKEWVAFRIADTGIGIDPEHSALIFQEFTQVDGSNTRKYGGMGLGLAISLRFARMMGGDITLVSALGQGSTFTVRLPAAVGAPAEIAVPAQPAERHV